MSRRRRCTNRFNGTDKCIRRIIASLVSNPKIVWASGFDLRIRLLECSQQPTPFSIFRSNTRSLAIHRKDSWSSVAKPKFVKFDRTWWGESAVIPEDENRRWKNGNQTEVDWNHKLRELPSKLPNLWDEQATLDSLRMSNPQAQWRENQFQTLICKNWQ